MIKHTHTEPTKINFSRLEESIMAIHYAFLGNFINSR